MKTSHVWLGSICRVLSMAVAGDVVQDAVRHPGGAWMTLRGFGRPPRSFPSQVTCGIMLEWLGMPRVPDAEPGLVGSGSCVFHGLEAPRSCPRWGTAWRGPCGAGSGHRRAALAQEALTLGQRHARGAAIDARRSAA